MSSRPGRPAARRRPSSGSGPWPASVHEQCGGPGVGAVGMCFTGGFALAMMVDDRLVAPVLSQPSLPLPAGKSKAADLGLSPDDLAARPGARRRRVPGAGTALPLGPGRRHAVRHAARAARRRLHRRGVRRQGPLGADRAPAGGGRREGDRLPPGAVARLRGSPDRVERHLLGRACSRPCRSGPGARRRRTRRPWAPCSGPAGT